MALRIVRPSGQPDGYEVPNLAPEFFRKGPANQRIYLEKILEEQAEAKTLYLTDWLNQAEAIWTMAGMIILGQAIEEHKFVAGKPVPKALSRYDVHVRSINGENIRWCRDMVPGRPIKKGAAQLMDGNEMPKQAFRVEEEWVEADSPDVMLDVKDAWMCLRQYGKHCRPAASANLRARYWKYEEVRPEGKVDVPDDEPKRKAKTFAEANRA